MKKMMRAFTALLTVCFLISSQAMALSAEENHGYAYSLTLSSGSGSFTEIMENAVTVNGNPAAVTWSEHEVIISGLHYGDAVQLNVQTEGAVTHTDGRYHVRGSGWPAGRRTRGAEFFSRTLSGRLEPDGKIEYPPYRRNL